MARVIGNLQRRKCNIVCTGPIRELNFICGPQYGVNLTTEKIGELVNSGKMVYEVNPENPKDVYLLTDTDYMDVHFSKKEADEEVEKEVVPPVEQPTNESLRVNTIPPRDNHGKKNKNRNNYQNQQGKAPEQEATDEEVVGADM